MKVKTADLIGPTLDWAVAQCEWGNRFPSSTDLIQIARRQEYSTSWSQGGPIIEREGIGIEKHRLDGPRQWAACDWHSVVVQGYTCLERSKYIYGPTQLIAAMRCFVASRFGDEVDIPEELLT